MRILLFLFSCSFAIAQHGINLIPVGAMHVEGNHIVDSAGQIIILRGAEIPGLETGADSDTLTPETFGAMRQRFNMNALRLPVSSAIAARDPLYLTRVATIVKQANTAGLVTILADYGAAPLPDPSEIPFWRSVASLFKDNPRVIFDLYNNPTGTDWQVWLHGSDRYVGMQALVNAVRSTGAAQIVAVQGFNDLPELQNFRAFLGDPDVIYEVHPWFSTDLTDADRDAHFGFLASQVPVFAGEWGFLPGENSANCRALPNTPEGAQQAIADTLAYFERREISWTYSTFRPGNLYIDHLDYARTDLTSSWNCDGNTRPGLGIGERVQYYLDGLREGDIVPVGGAGGNVVGSARGSAMHIYGNMADQTVISGPEPPETLGGIRLQLTDASGAVMLTPLLYISPTLVNAVIPGTAALGIGELRILGGPYDGSRGTLLIREVQPGIFTAPATGHGAAIGIVNGNPIWNCSDGTCLPLPIPAGNVVRFIGAGIRNARGPVTATIGGFDAPVLFAGPLNLAEGIDAVDVQIGSAVTGETDLLIFVDGIQSNPVRIKVGNE
jgi:uncharacterized protein (TIGR03437 family)